MKKKIIIPCIIIAIISLIVAIIVVKNTSNKKEVEQTENVNEKISETEEAKDVIKNILMR